MKDPFYTFREELGSWPGNNEAAPIANENPTTYNEVSKIENSQEFVIVNVGYSSLAI